MFEATAIVIAIVEDDAEMRQAMRRVLEVEGFATELFASAEEFIAAGAASRVQCLVLDIQLPGISGVELHRRLESAGCKLPTVFVTGRQELCQGSADMKGAKCLVKPFPGESLIQAVRTRAH